MDPKFWLKRWEENVIGFHMSSANPLLVKYFDELSLREGARIFIPLCGKTLDIAWLLGRGYKVVGAELSHTAIEQLFAELGIEPQIENRGRLDRYYAQNIEIFVGDIFLLTEEVLAEVDAVYDRAALVALPFEMRRQYTTHLLTLTADAPQILLSFEYDQSQVDGPPFSVNTDEVEQHYSKHYRVQLLERVNVPDGLKGKCEAFECVWLLKNKIAEA